MPAAIYLIIRAFGVIVLAVWSPHGLLDRLSAWDGLWYLKIAAHGYDLGAVLDAHGQLNSFTPRAFFPAYPWLVRTLAEGLGIGLVPASLCVSAISGLFAAYGLARLGRIVRGGSVCAGYLLVALFAAAPMGVVLSMSYTEALFCALAVWALVGVLEERWVLAGVCCAGAGLVRSTAFALVLTVVLAAVVDLVRRRESGRPLIAIVLAPLGLAGYLWWTGLRVRPDAGLFEQLRTWSDLEWLGWATSFDGGAETWNFLGSALVSPAGMTVLTGGVIVGALLLLGVAMARRVEWPLVVYAAVVMVMCLGSSSLMHAKPRFLLPAFTLLVPIAIGLSNRRPSTAVLTVCGTAVLSAWFGAYALVVWKYAI